MGFLITFWMFARLTKLMRPLNYTVDFQSLFMSLEQCRFGAVCSKGRYGTTWMAPIPTATCQYMGWPISTKDHGPIVVPLDVSPFRNRRQSSIKSRMRLGPMSLCIWYYLQLPTFRILIQFSTTRTTSSPVFKSQSIINTLLLSRVSSVFKDGSNFIQCLQISALKDQDHGVTYLLCHHIWHLLSRCKSWKVILPRANGLERWTNMC